MMIRVTTKQPMSIGMTEDYFQRYIQNKNLRVISSLKKDVIVEDEKGSTWYVPVGEFEFVD